MLGMQSIGEVAFWGCGVLELWDVEDLRFCGCGMFGM